MRTSLIVSIILMTAIESCSDCYENPNIWIPSDISSIRLKEEYNVGVTYLGANVYPNGTYLDIIESRNPVYSVVRNDPFYGTPISFFWSDNVAPNIGVGWQYPFNELQIGEIVNCYVAIGNVKPNYNPSCSFKKPKKIESISEVIVQTKGGKVIDAHKVEETRYDIPAGQYAVFQFPVEYKGPDNNYSLNLKFDLDGKLVSTDTVKLKAFGL